MSLRSIRWAASLVFLVACSSSSPEPTHDVNVPAADGGATAPANANARIAFFQGDAPVTSLQWGEPFTIRVDGLTPGAEVTLRAANRLLDGDYASESVFRADDAGRVDTGTQAPARGAYDGVDPDGVWWSMTKSAAPIAGLADDFALRVEIVAGDAVVATSTLERWYGKKDVVRVDVKDQGLVGLYMAPNDGKKHPVIVAFGGSEGGIEGGADVAAYWSARGYAVLGLAYFGTTGLPQYLEEIPLDYFGKAFDWVGQRTEADAAKLAVWGASRGGELALLLGATFPRVHAVIADVPSGVAWGAPQLTGPEKASWTYKGAPLPFVPGDDSAQPTTWPLPTGGTATAYRPTFEASIAHATKMQLDAATTKVENIAGPVLMLGGGDDQLWPSCQLAQIAMDRLKAAGHTTKYADDLVCYPDAGHASTFVPGVATIDSLAVDDPYSNGKMALGGTPKGLAHAQRDALRRTDAFLRAALSP